MPTPPENSVIGQIWGWMTVDCGPTIGLVRRPMFNDRFVTTGTTYTIQPYDFQILIAVAAPFTVFLPSVNTWMKQPWGMFPIFVKDNGLVAATHNITVDADGSDLIDGLPNVIIASNGGSLSLRPKSDLTGWDLTL